MLHMYPTQNAFGAMTSHRTTVFHIDLTGRIVSLPEDAAHILTTCQDVIGIDADNRLILCEPETQPPLLTPVRVAGLQQHNPVKFYSALARTHLTIHILQRAGLGATIVVFAPGLNTTPDVSKLTQREREVLLLAAKGLRRDRMAHALGVSIATIDLHCANLRRKMGAKTTSEAVAKAFTHLGA